MMYRARRTEARIQQMLWKVNYSDIVFLNTVYEHFVIDFWTYIHVEYIKKIKRFNSSSCSISNGKKNSNNIFMKFVVKFWDLFFWRSG